MLHLKLLWTSRKALSETSALAFTNAVLVPLVLCTSPDITWEALDHLCCDLILHLTFRREEKIRYRRILITFRLY